MKQVREWIGGLVGLTLLIALGLALNSLFQAQAEQTGAAASPTLVKQTGATPTSTPRPPLSFESISVARRYALRVEAPVLEDNIYNQYRAPLFSPNGQAMLFHKPVSGANANCVGSTGSIIVYELWRTDVQGRSPVRLAKGVIGSAVWSPDSQRIAYISCTPTGEGSLRVMRAEGSEEQLITSDVGGVKPEWLDAQTVVYVSRERGVIAFDLETNRSQRLDPPELKMNPETGTFAVSPQGDRMILGVGPELWIMPLDTRKLIPITPFFGAFEGGQGSIAWSADGSRVAYASRSSIYLVDKNGNVLTEIKPAWSPRLLTWSSDGHSLFFAGRTEDRGNYEEIHLIDAEGYKVKQLTNNRIDANREGIDSLIWPPNGIGLIYGTWSLAQKVQVLELTPSSYQSPTKEIPRPFVQSPTRTLTPTPPPLSDCPYQPGNNGTIWIHRREWGNGKVVNIPFERGIASIPSLSNYLGGVLEREIGGTAETRLEDWQPEMARAFAIAARSVAAYWCPRAGIIMQDDQGRFHYGLRDNSFQYYHPGWSPSRAAEYRTFVADTISQTLIYNGRIFDAQYRT